MRRSSIGSDPKDRTVSSSMSRVCTLSGWGGDGAIGGDGAGASSSPGVECASVTSGMLAKTSNDGIGEGCAGLSDGVGFGDGRGSSSGISSKPGSGSEVSTAL